MPISSSETFPHLPTHCHWARQAGPSQGEACRGREQATAVMVAAESQNV